MLQPRVEPLKQGLAGIDAKSQAPRLSTWASNTIILGASSTAESALIIHLYCLSYCLW
jgi:hypothetical protein